METAICARCLPSELTALRERVRAVGRLEREIDDATYRLREIEMKHAKVEEMLAIEKQGRQAYSRGLAQSDNPFTPGSDECVMWLSGWAQEECVALSASRNMVMTWAHGALQVVKQILEAGGNVSEAIEKITHVMDRIDAHTEPSEPEEA
jgi:hypothetical protein